MPHPLSNDLRERVVAHVEAEHSCREASGHFGTSVSFVVNLMKLWRETGRVDPRPRGGFRHGKIGPHRDFILAAVAAKRDITMPELAEKLVEAKGVRADPSNLSKFLIACGLSFKNVWPAPLQVICREHHEQSASTYPASGLNPGQDGDTRVPVLIKLPVLNTVFLTRFPERRSTVRPSRFHHSQSSSADQQPFAVRLVTTRPRVFPWH